MIGSYRIFNISCRIVSCRAGPYRIVSHPIFYIQPSHPSILYVYVMFARLWCHCDLFFLALLRVLCIAFVSLRSPSPHLLLLHVGASWSRTHSCHAACQYSINPATFGFPWGPRAAGFLPHSLTAAVCARRKESALGSVFLYKGKEQKPRPIIFTLPAFIQPAPIRSSEGRRSVNSRLRGAGHVALYFLSEVEWMGLLVSLFEEKMKREENKNRNCVKFNDGLPLNGSENRSKSGENSFESSTTFW